MDWDKYDDFKIIALLDKGAKAERWARRTFFICGFGFVVVSMLIVFR